MRSARRARSAPRRTDARRNAGTPPPAATAALPPEDQPEQGQPEELPPNLRRQMVDFQTKEPAGTIIIDTPNTYLYLVLGHGKAMRYGIGVGREGFTWSGTERISNMREWPDWYPPAEMIERQPYLPRMMAADRAIRSARARSISATRSTASTAPTSPRPSARPCRPAASGCSTRTSRICSAACRSARASWCCPARRRRRWPTRAGPTPPGRPTRAPDTGARNASALNTGEPDDGARNVRVPTTGTVLNAPNSGAVLNMGTASPPPPPPHKGAAVSASPRLR